MSDDKPTQREGAEPERQDAPNQQNVRPDGSGPADEGSGGSARKETKAEQKEREEALAPEVEETTETKETKRTTRREAS